MHCLGLRDARRWAPRGCAQCNMVPTDLAEGTRVHTNATCSLTNARTRTLRGQPSQTGSNQIYTGLPTSYCFRRSIVSSCQLLWTALPASNGTSPRRLETDPPMHFHGQHILSCLATYKDGEVSLSMPEFCRCCHHIQSSSA